MEYLGRSRNIPPAVYNINRLNERPLPELIVQPRVQHNGNEIQLSAIETNEPNERLPRRLHYSGGSEPEMQNEMSHDENDLENLNINRSQSPMTLASLENQENQSPNLGPNTQNQNTNKNQIENGSTSQAASTLASTSTAVNIPRNMLYDDIDLVNANLAINFNVYNDNNQCHGNQQNIQDENLLSAAANIKAEGPLAVVLPCRSNENELNALLDVNEIIVVDDDVTIFASSKPCKPFIMTSESLFKRNDDIVSGNIAFNETVSIFLNTFTFTC